jgi:hypothetical protein
MLIRWWARRGVGLRCMRCPAGRADAVAPPMPALATSPLIFALGRLLGEGRARPALAGQAPGFACRVEGAGAGGDTRTSGARRRLVYHSV